MSFSQNDFGPTKVPTPTPYMWRKSEEMILNRAWLMRRQMIVVRHFGTQICNFHLAMGFMLGFQFLCLIWSVLSLGRSFFFFHFLPSVLLWLGIGQQLPGDAAPVCMIIVPMYHAAPETLAHCSHVLFNWDLMMVNTIQLWYRPDTINIFIQYSSCDIETIHGTWVSATIKTAQGSTPVQLRVTTTANNIKYLVNIVQK